MLCVGRKGEQQQCKGSIAEDFHQAHIHISKKMYLKISFAYDKYLSMHNILHVYLHKQGTENKSSCEQTVFPS